MWLEICSSFMKKIAEGNSYLVLLLLDINEIKILALYGQSRDILSADHYYFK